MPAENHIRQPEQCNPGHGGPIVATARADRRPYVTSEMAENSLNRDLGTHCPHPGLKEWQRFVRLRV